MARLGDVFPLVRNGASIKQTDGAAGIPITRIETISNREIDRNKFGYADIIDDSKYKDYILQDGDILMSHINSEKHLGKVALYKKQGNEQIIHGMNLLMLRANPSVLFPPFAIYFFETSAFLLQIKKITKKSVNQASFTVKSLKEVEIPLPPIDEQRKIAAVLDKIGDLIAKRRQQLDKLDELVKSRFIEMFGDPVLNPFEWQKTTLETNATLLNGRAYSQDELLDSGKYPVLRVGNFFSNRGWYYSDLELEEDKYCDNGDLLYAWSASFGPQIWHGGKVIYHYHIWKVLVGNAYNKLFLCKLLEYTTESLMGETHGIAMLHLTKSGMEKTEFIVPPLALQEQFAAFVTQTDKSKLAIQKSLEKLEILKKALMQKYFG